MTEATFVFRHSDEKEARRFCKELFEHYPFGGDGPTHVIAVSVGDAMSVADAVRSALLCKALHGSTEREEFALAMCEAVNWDDCLKIAGEWELAYEEGLFVDLRKASADTRPQGGDATEIAAPASPSGAVGSEADETPNPSGESQQ